MARVPTWAELRLDATKLFQHQRQCYNSVHELLDVRVPELDRKLSLLNHEYQDIPDRTYLQHTGAELPEYEEILEFVDQHMSRTVSNMDFVQHQPTLPTYQNEPNHQDTIPVLQPARTIPKSQTHSGLMCFSPPPARKQQRHKQHPQKQENTRKPKAPECQPPQKQRKQQVRREQTRTTQPATANHELNLNELEHLRAPPFPLSEYLKRYRPDVVYRADQRSTYIREAIEKRKLIASSKIIHSFKNLRLSSRSLNRKAAEHPTISRSSSRNFAVPEYRVKCKLSEQEMKRLTARLYKQLPEVKEKRKEQMSNLLRVQNYKNKLEFGRKLLENRRRGKINYPLRTSCEDNSIVSSQDDSLNGYGPGSADAFSSDPFY